MRIILVLLFVMTFSVVQPANAAEFPVKPIQLVIPWNPGGGNDILGRVLADQLKKILPQPVVVSNITGASGLNGINAVRRAQPDGYTILLEHPGNFNAAVVGTSAGFTWQDLDPICVLARAHTAVIIPKNSPFNNMKEVVEFAKANPKKLRWGLGLNTISFTTYLAIQQAVGGMNVIYINTQGDKNRIVSTLGGNGDIGTVGYSSAEPYVQSGDLKILAVVNSTRNPFAPNVPTLKEQGIDVAIDFTYSLFAPKNTPESVKKTLRDAFEKALQTPEAQKAMQAAAFEPYFKNEEDMRVIWKEGAAWAQRMVDYKNSLPK